MKVPYVLKDNYLQVTVKGQPFALDKSHPTFDRLKKAIKQHRWSLIPKLVTLAKSINFESQGNVSLVKGVVYYKSQPVNDSLSKRIIEMVRRGKKVKHLLLFMDNLYQNPSKTAIESFYDWLRDNDLPITDNGCFLAYKSVRDDYTDTHSGTVDNHPGQVIMMSRKVVDTDYYHQCSTGFHVCSKRYGIYGSRVLAVMINPKYVLSAVEGKMRVTQYEVLMELGQKYQDNLGDIDPNIFEKKGIAGIEGQLVIEVKKERQELINMILKSPAIKKALRRKKLSKITITKASYARLKSMAQKYDLVPSIGPEASHKLMMARKAAGITIGQVAEKLGIGYKAVYTLEKEVNPSQERVDKYLLAVANLRGYNKAVSYPIPTRN